MAWYLLRPLSMNRKEQTLWYLRASGNEDIADQLEKLEVNDWEEMAVQVVQSDIDDHKRSIQYRKESEEREREEEARKAERRKVACGIYAIVCRNKVYVGQSVDIPNRICQHKSVLKRGKHGNKEIQKDWDNHKDEFEFLTIEIVPQEKLSEKEKEYIIDFYQQGKHMYNTVHVPKPVENKYESLFKKIASLIDKGRLDKDQLLQYLDTL